MSLSVSSERESNSQFIRNHFQKVKAEERGVRTRNAAQTMGISEGELVAVHVGDNVIRLIDDAATILKKVATFGEVMALTRNEFCVHERHGVYENHNFFSHGRMEMGLFVNADIDLRLFMNHWKHSFSVIEKTKIGMRKSLQFFDKEGQAIHKIYITKQSNEDAYDELIIKCMHENQEAFIEVEAYEKKSSYKSDDEIDWVRFRSEWENLKDTHDFFPMLNKFKVGREQAFEKIGHDFAYEVENTATRNVLELARDNDCEIMVFVGNRGCIQIHTGPVNKLVEHGLWYNVLDPKFNLHLSENNIARTWVTKKPTEDGIVTALELFDQDSEIIATLFGKRKPGVPELEMWRKIIEKIPVKGSSNEA